MVDFSTWQRPREVAEGFGEGFGGARFDPGRGEPRGEKRGSCGSAADASFERRVGEFFEANAVDDFAAIVANDFDASLAHGVA